MRISSRGSGELRPIELALGCQRHAEGSCRIKMGNTETIASASLAEPVPRWLRDSGKGWITAKYSLLPRSTESRNPREARLGRQSARTQEIQRLIGRCRRASVDLKKLGARQIIVDSDVLDADGGTRTAAITAAWLAVQQCFHFMMGRGIISVDPRISHVAAVSCGIVDGEALLDLDYGEDSAADADFNFAMNERSELIEMQGSAEKLAVTDSQLEDMFALARTAIGELIDKQWHCLGGLR